MRISSSNIGMESARSYSSVTRQSARFYEGTKSLTDGEGKGFLGSFWGMEDGGENADQKGSNEKTTLQDVTLHLQNLSNTGKVRAGREAKTARETIRQQCLRFLMYVLFGSDHKRKNSQRADSETGSGAGSGAGSKASSGETYDIVEKNVSYSASYYHSESELTCFSATGVVKTADGREISFGMSLQMSRRFREYYEEHYDLTILEARFTDPLVINLNGNIAELSDQKFYFDLDCDGEEEEISSLQSGSGFLALDLNGDGVINDGSELFGTRSGDGFKDLAAYDSDGNGWIDEDDEIWDKLLIWCKDENGKDKLYTLAEAGVGAICLQSASTEFSLNSVKDNHNNGVIRSTGIFLYENGNVGTVQHLDLAQ